MFKIDYVIDIIVAIQKKNIENKIHRTLIQSTFEKKTIRSKGSSSRQLLKACT